MLHLRKRRYSKCKDLTCIIIFNSIADALGVVVNILKPCQIPANTMIYNRKISSVYMLSKYNKIIRSVVINGYFLR